MCSPKHTGPLSEAIVFLPYYSGPDFIYYSAEINQEASRGATRRDNTDSTPNTHRAAVGSVGLQTDRRAACALSRYQSDISNDNGSLQTPNKKTRAK